MGVRTIDIGDGHSIDIDSAWLDIGRDLEESGGDIAANIGKCADARLVLMQKHEHLEVHFRNWKAEVAAEALTIDPKIAEWKVKVLYQSKPEYIDHNESITFIRAQLEWVSSVQRALEVKAQMVRTMINTDREIQRAERSTGMAPRTKPSRDNRARIPKNRNED